MIDRTPKEKDIYEYISECLEKNGCAPSVRDICAALGIKSTSSVHEYLRRLETKGYIRKSSGKSRALSIEGNGQNESNKMKRVPILGRVTAGQPILAVENIERTFPLPMDFARNKDVFMLKVKGDSMINVGIYDGDLLIVTPQKVAQNGDIVVAVIGEEATVKTFYREKDRIRLQPENDAMEPIYVKEDVQLAGRVTGLFRTMH